MPSVAPNSRIKRLLSAPQPSGEDLKPRKKSRVRFDDNIQVIKRENEEELDSVSIGAIDDDEDLDFDLSIGEDGELDYTIKTKDPADDKQLNVISAIERPMSPIEGCERCFSDDEPCSSDLEDEEFVDVSDSSIPTEGTYLKISIEACNRVVSSEPPIAPLITPPASPRRVSTVSVNGLEEEATICEWPSNLAVDIAITAASMDSEMSP
jgi:hypothetical protein